MLRVVVRSNPRAKQIIPVGLLHVVDEAVAIDPFGNMVYLKNRGGDTSGPVRTAADDCVVAHYDSDTNTLVHEEVRFVDERDIEKLIRARASLGVARTSSVRPQLASQPTSYLLSLQAEIERELDARAKAGL